MDTVEVESTENKKRGFWLTAFLILMFVANPFTAFTYFSNPEAIIQVYPSLSEGLLYFMGLLAVLNVVFAIAIWTWRKAGVYGIYASMAIAFLINLYIGIGIVGSLTGLIGVVLIYFTTKNRWQLFS
ncbi:MAG: hypothetical protein JXQ95_19220 [Alteromonas stellipolaris]|uniref:hypothetical protein n=1 Tax=Alteromonas stellipolaris TaxID=233316 RepID=UPI003B8BB2F6